MDTPVPHFLGSRLQLVLVTALFIAALTSPISAPAQDQGEANYDFQPGERTLFATDFASVNTGDFPRRLSFVNGAMEVIEWEGAHVLRVNSSGSAFDIQLGEELPERFTLEFDFHTPHYYNDLGVHPVGEDGEPMGDNYLYVNPYAAEGSGGVGIGAFYRTGAATSLSYAHEPIISRMTPIRLMADGRYVKVFVEQRRVANIPNADLGRSGTLRFDFYNVNVHHGPIYVSGIRVAAGGRDLYEALENEGRVAVQDVLFDTGQATIKQASAETLAEIAAFLEDHAEIRLLVEGHTDNQGDFQANITLSKARAEAVETYLVERHGIDAERIETIGLGQTTPAAPEDTPEGRAENRRVELVRMP
ncbi:MAG: OmpA family protein [Bacteroidetes bacterium]|jgi:outer membrane protein OmpA-like peptidoglycan-associated protein|nr:OmpA family protein [Bacteroidota bacterium]